MTDTPIPPSDSTPIIPTLTIEDVQRMLGGAQIELWQTRQAAEATIQRLQAELRALKAEIDRLTTEHTKRSKLKAVAEPSE